MRNFSCGVIIVLLAISVSSLAFNVQPVKAAGGTIYIRADGSVDPPSAPILNVGNVSYTFTADINDLIVVERNDIVVDGAGHTLEGNGTGNGVSLAGRSNVTIESIKIRRFDNGIYLSSSYGNAISANTITNSNHAGIHLYESSGNSISANTITNNTWYGIIIYNASSNKLYHNNFTNNTNQAYSYAPEYSNTWDDGYPSGGNYWSSYAGTDANNDGIGDTPYVIDADNTDHYPLMSPWAPVTDLASLVVRGQNNIIYYRTYNVTTASWNDWKALPGATCDSPAAAACGNELHIVVRGMDGDTLWHGYVNLIGGGFSGWTLLSGSTPSAPTLTANGTHLCLVVRGQNNLIYYRFNNVASRTWADWTALPSGSTCDSPAATVLANKLHAVVRGMDGYTLWHSNVDLSTGTFSGWDLIDGATESKPTLATCHARNEMNLVVRGLNNVIYRKAWSDSGWNGWSGLPSGTTCDGVGAAALGEKLYLVVRGMDGYTLWHGTVDLTDNFPGWNLLSGSTPSTPTLATIRLSVAIKPFLSVFDISEDGLTEWFQSQYSAVHYEGTYNRTYFSFCDDEGREKVKYYDHQTQAFSQEIVIKTYAYRDDHMAPSLLILPNGTLLVFYTFGDDAVYMKASTNPEDISSWGSEITIESGRGCYPQPIRTSDGKLWLFYRFYAGVQYRKFGYKTSTDNGTTWGSYVVLADFGDSWWAYGWVAKGTDDSIHVMLNPYSYTSAIQRKIGYMWTSDGSNWQMRNETSITLPVTQATMDLVYDYGADSINVWGFDLKLDSSNNPYIAFVNDTVLAADQHGMWAKWTGSAWATYFVAHTYRFIASGYSSGLVIDPSNVSVCYVAAKINGASRSEIQKWTSADGGQTWSNEKNVTDNSTYSQIRPQMVRNYNDEVMLWWAEISSYASYSSWTSRLRGYGRAMHA